MLVNLFMCLVNTVILPDMFQLVVLASQAHYRRVEIGQVLLDTFLSIPFRVDRDENETDLLCCLPQLGFELFKIGQCQRAYIRAIGITEKHQNHFSLLIAQLERLPILVSKGEILRGNRWNDQGTLENRWPGKQLRPQDGSQAYQSSQAKIQEMLALHKFLPLPGLGPFNRAITRGYPNYLCQPTHQIKRRVEEYPHH